MENNYDYFPSAEESATPAHFDLDHNDPLYTDNDTSPDSSEGADRQRFAPRAILSEENSKPDDHAISKKDLLYYMDDKRLRRSNDVVEPEDFDDDNDKTSPKVKYKVLKVSKEFATLKKRNRFTSRQSILFHLSANFDFLYDWSYDLCFFPSMGCL